MKLMRRAYSRMGIALIVYLVLGDAISLALSALMPYLPAFLKNQLALYLIVHGISLPAFFLFARWAEEIPGTEEDGREERMGNLPRRRMKLWQFVMTYVMTMGVAYVFNFIGLFINMGISGGEGYTEMNPVYAMMEGMDLWFALYVGILGPVVEEVVYRGVVLGTLKRFGQREAVLFSAAVFGLMHGNIAQSLYAAAIGLIFGFVTVRSGSIFYSCVLHVMVNSYSLVLSACLGAVSLWGNPLIFSLFSALVLAVTLTFVLAGLIFLGVLFRRGSFYVESGAERLGVSKSCMLKTAFINPGFILFSLICLVSIVQYMRA